MIIYFVGDSISIISEITVNMEYLMDLSYDIRYLDIVFELGQIVNKMMQ